MERDIHVETFLTLSKSGINETMKEANKEAIAEFGKEEGKDELYYPDCIWEVDELYFDEDDQEIVLNGEIFCKGEKLGYLSPSIKISDSTVVEIIDYYMKKLDKLRAVLKD